MRLEGPQRTWGAGPLVGESKKAPHSPNTLRGTFGKRGSWAVIEGAEEWLWWAVMRGAGAWGLGTGTGGEKVGTDPRAYYSPEETDPPGVHRSEGHRDKWSGKLSVRVGGWLRAETPAASSCDLLQGPGPSRRMQKAPQPSSPGQAAKAAPAWLRPQEAGSRAGWGPGGGGDPAEYNGQEFHKVRVTGPSGEASGGVVPELPLRLGWCRPARGGRWGAPGYPLPRVQNGDQEGNKAQQTGPRVEGDPRRTHPAARRPGPAPRRRASRGASSARSASSAHSQNWGEAAAQPARPGGGAGGGVAGGGAPGGSGEGGPAGEPHLGALESSARFLYGKALHGDTVAPHAHTRVGTLRRSPLEARCQGEPLPLLPLPVQVLIVAMATDEGLDAGHRGGRLPKRTQVLEVGEGAV